MTPDHSHSPQETGMPMYNHAFTIAFTVDTTTEDPHAVPLPELLAALARRIEELRRDPLELRECCDHFDTYKFERGE